MLQEVIFKPKKKIEKNYQPSNPNFEKDVPKTQNYISFLVSL
jgi:hypothetical protein